MSLSHDHDSHLSEIERLLCSPDALGSVEAVTPRVPEAWTLQLPDLSSLPATSGDWRPLKICIATEDIVGPVRNGGIGTTYAALAERLAQLGHDVSILYLKGTEVETGDIDHWIAHYAAKGVSFIPAPDYAKADKLQTHADRWLHAPYNMYCYIAEHPMDVVHVSEWRGSGLFCLLAKRQGLAFENTLFVVKTSSPWMWNRLYGSQTLDRLDDLAKIQAERRSVELADMVVGGSLHLLRWMASQGYRLPIGRTFVQPNVAVFEHLKDLLGKRALTAGARTPITEFVFFGRLEARKGLFVFCQAIKRLIRQGVALPPVITFMGKQGARLTARPNQSILEYIEAETRNWPTKVNIYTDFQQYEALDYLIAGPRLAIMPSVIENSSMAIYEAAICGIPCVASNVGGNAELLHAEDRPNVLCEPHPISLADKLTEALALGGYVPRASFDNDTNLEIWRDFHQNLAKGLLETLLSEHKSSEGFTTNSTVDAIVYFTGQDSLLAESLASLKQQSRPPALTIIAVDSDDQGAVARARAAAAAHGLPCTVVEAFDLDAGAALNLGVLQGQSEFLVTLWEGMTLTADALMVLAEVAITKPADVLSYLFEAQGSPAHGSDSTLLAPVRESVADLFFDADTSALPLFIRRSTFASLDGFTTDYRVLCHDHEFFTRARLAGHRCDVVLRRLGTVKPWDRQWLADRCYDLPASQFRSARPHLAASPLAIRDLLLSSKGLQMRGAGAKRSDRTDLTFDAPLTRMMQAILADRTGASGRPRTAAKPRSSSETASDTLKALLEKEAAKSSLTTHSFQPLRSSATQRTAPPPRSAPQDTGPTARHGQLLAIHDQTLFGWALDPDAPERPLNLKLEIEGKTWIFPADRPPPLAAGRNLDVKTGGFIIPLPKLSPWPWSRPRERRFNLTVVEFDETLASDRLCLEPGGRATDHGVEGYCDPSETPSINGWLWHPDSPDRILSVSVFLNGLFFRTVLADQYREDLRQHGIGTGEHAFSIAIPRHLHEAASRGIDVVVHDLGLSLPRSPLRLINGAVRSVGRVPPKKPRKTSK